MLSYWMTRLLADWIKEKSDSSVEDMRGELKKIREFDRAKEIFKEYLPSKVREPFEWAPQIIGIVERVIYTSSIILNQYGGIAVWMAVKVIGEWGDTADEKGKITRIRVNNFLINSGVSLILGVIGGLLFRLIIGEDFNKIINLK